MLDNTPRRHRPLTTATAPAESDLVFGAENIGKVTNQTAGAVRYWFYKGLYGDAVWKPGPKTFLGSRQRLLNLGKQSS